MSIGKKCMKRLYGDVRLLKKDPHEYIDVSPGETNPLEWHFLIKAPSDSDYAGGYYLGKLLFKPEYPDKPPDYMMLTPSGRYTIGTKICLSNSGFHANEWSSQWTMHAILNGFLSIMMDDTEHGLSHIRASKEERKQFALESIEYNKAHYPDLVKLFTRFLDADGNPISFTEAPDDKN